MRKDSARLGISRHFQLFARGFSFFLEAKRATYTKVNRDLTTSSRRPQVSSASGNPAQKAHNHHNHHKHPIPNFLSIENWSTVAPYEAPTSLFIMSLLPAEVHTELEQLLQALQSKDNNVRAQAEEHLQNNWTNTRPEVLLLGLAEQISASTNTAVRCYGV